MPMTGAELFLKALKSEQVHTLSAYPGGQATDLFDALYGEEDIQIILPRHEQGLILIESVQTEAENTRLAALLKNALQTGLKLCREAAWE